MKAHVLTTLAAGALLVLTAARADAVPEELGLSARVSDAGVPINGARTFTIRLFDAASGGTQMWTESDAATAVDGLVYLTLGDQAALDATVLDGGPLWVELQVDSTVLSPRLAVTSAAYAVRAGVAEDAERLGGMASTSFAAAGHDHSGTYLPVGPSLVCTGTSKVTGINPSTGSVTCGADVDTNSTYAAGAGLSLTGNTFAANLPGGTCPAGQKVSAISATGAATCSADINTIILPGVGLSQSGNQINVNFAGSGTAITAARSNHDHAGSYLPVNPSSQCTGNNKMYGINTTTGAVMCAGDQDTNTTYTAATGLGLTPTNQFFVQFGGTGGATTAARSDHHHATTSCPSGFTTYSRIANGTTSVICLRTVTSGLNWHTASRACMNGYGATLCSYEQMTQIRGINAAFSITAGYWLADRMGQNSAYSTSTGGTVDLFDQVSSVNDVRPYYCCLERRWW